MTRQPMNDQPTGANGGMAMPLGRSLNNPKKAT